MVTFPESVYVHPAAVVLGDVSVGEYSSLWPCSVVRGDYAPIRIGRFTSIQDCCVLHSAPDAPIKVGDFVIVGHGAVLHGCTVEDACLISMNATVLDGAVIGSGTIVGAGAVVMAGTRVPPNSMVLGVPGQVKEGRPGQAEYLKSGAMSYTALAQTCLEGGETISREQLVKKMAELKKLAVA